VFAGSDVEPQYMLYEKPKSTFCRAPTAGSLLPDPSTPTKYFPLVRDRECTRRAQLWTLVANYIAEHRDVKTLAKMRSVSFQWWLTATYAANTIAAFSYIPTEERDSVSVPPHIYNTIPPPLPRMPTYAPEILYSVGTDMELVVPGTEAHELRQLRITELVDVGPLKDCQVVIGDLRFLHKDMPTTTPTKVEVRIYDPVYINIALQPLMPGEPDLETNCFGLHSRRFSVYGNFSFDMDVLKYLCTIENGTGGYLSSPPGVLHFFRPERELVGERGMPCIVRDPPGSGIPLATWGREAALKGSRKEFFECVGNIRVCFQRGIIKNGFTFQGLRGRS
jgi:hypothetical protein